MVLASILLSLSLSHGSANSLENVKQRKREKEKKKLKSNSRIIDKRNWISFDVRFAFLQTYGFHLTCARSQTCLARLIHETGEYVLACVRTCVCARFPFPGTRSLIGLWQKFSQQCGKVGGSGKKSTGIYLSKIKTVITTFINIFTFSSLAHSSPEPTGLGGRNKML